MDTKNVRTRSSGAHTSLHDGDAQRRYGVNWPFPPVGGPKPMTAKQRKLDKAKQLADAEEAPF